MYIGYPSENYDAIEFQAAWLLKCRNGIVDKEFRRKLTEVRHTALKNKSDFETLCSQAFKISDTPLAPASQHLTQFAPSVTGLTKTPKDGGSTAAPPASKPQGTIRPNLLLPYWRNDFGKARDRHKSKDNVIAQVAKTIMTAAKKPSKACQYLLPLLLNYENMSLGSVLREKIDSQQVRDLTYGLMVMADTEGQYMSDDALAGFRKFVNVPQGDQLLAMVELRNTLENWAMVPEAGMDSLYDLTAFRSDLSEYFLPQQWKRAKKPTARDMFRFAAELDPGKDTPDTRGRIPDKKGVLGVMAWLLRAVSAGDARAQAAVGYYFRECGDFRRYMYYTRRGAQRGSFQAKYNLGVSYVSDHRKT
jgi:hypothetical protein